ncbi:MAG TPA: hypothetical protein PLP22_00865 [Candidatus Competibacter sp.]|nr:hypothetical protein [Candidatus Competibacter sp.]HUM93041.1 hypothetical protein [Candidatus Competibacter sp.]
MNAQTDSAPASQHYSSFLPLTHFFRIPYGRVVELDTQVEL